MSPLRHNGISDGNICDGNNANHRHHILHGPKNFHHHNHPLLSPQLENAITERPLQPGHGAHTRGMMNQHLNSSRVRKDIIYKFKL